MSDFEKLKKIDIEEIHKKTYISRKNIKALLNRDFSQFDRLKAVGFVKIIEREFDLDLSDLKEDVDKYFNKKDDEPTVKNEEIEKEKNKESKTLLIIGVLAILAVAIFVYFQKSSKPKNIKKEIINANKTIKEKNSIVSINEENESNKTKEQPLLDIKKEDQNISLNLDANKTDVKDENLSKKAILPSITIVPKQKIWLGVIYLDNYKRKAYLTSSPIELNSSRDFLILTGHGMLKTDIDSNITDYSDSKKLRFLYKDGKLQKIDKETFKEFNRGKNW